jgi:hypothetical protein
MNDKNHKNIYVALQIKKVPFTMYKKEDMNVFVFNSNTIVLKNDKIIVNNEEYNNINDVLSFIKKA